MNSALDDVIKLIRTNENKYFRSEIETANRAAAELEQMRRDYRICRCEIMELRAALDKAQKVIVEYSKQDRNNYVGKGLAIAWLVENEEKP